RGKGNQLQASRPSDLPYLMALKEVGEMPGLEPITLDFALKRGVWIDVKVTDKVTGKPVACWLEYAPFTDNPHLKEVPDFADKPRGQRVAEDGKFRLVGLPGRGLIGVHALKNHYRLSVGTDKIEGWDKKFGTFQTSPQPLNVIDFHALVEVNPDKA